MHQEQIAPEKRQMHFWVKPPSVLDDFESSNLPFNVLMAGKDAKVCLSRFICREEVRAFCLVFHVCFESIILKVIKSGKVSFSRTSHHSLSERSHPFLIGILLQLI